MCQGVFPSAFNSSCDCSRTDYYHSSCNDNPVVVDDASNYDGAVRARDDRGGKSAITINPRLTSYLSTAAGVPSKSSWADGHARGIASTSDGRQGRGTGKQVEGGGISAASRMVAASSSLAMLGSRWGELLSSSGSSGARNGRESSTPNKKKEAPNDTPHFIHAFFFDST